MIQVSEVPTANPKLIYSAGDEWKALGLSPVGETTFRAYWRALFQRQKGSPVDAVVAQMYEAARRFGIPIPEEFAVAARKAGGA